MTDLASVDMKSFTMRIAKLKSKAKATSAFSLVQVGYEIMRLSQLEVPHDKGTLQNSGEVEEQGQDVLVGYHTPYAHRLHEHPEYNFKQGRKGHYLTDPIIKNSEVLGLTYAKTLEERLGNG